MIPEKVDIVGMYNRLMRLKQSRRRKRPLSFDEACDFIVATTGQSVEHVKQQLREHADDRANG